MSASTVIVAVNARMLRVSRSGVKVHQDSRVIAQPLPRRSCGNAQHAVGLRLADANM